MGFESKKIRALVALLVVLACCLGLLGCDKEVVESAQNEATTPSAEEQETIVQTEPEAEPEAAQKVELVVESTEEKEDSIIVTTSFCQLRYPFAFADLIQIKEQNDASVSSLEFSVLIKNEMYPIFAVRFGEGEGIPLGSILVPGETEDRPVYAELYVPDEVALGENANTYYAAQETFNDIVEALSENPNFESVQ